MGEGFSQGRKKPVLQFSGIGSPSENQDWTGCR